MEIKKFNLADILLKLLGKVSKKKNASEFQARLADIEYFFHDFLPQREPNFAEKIVIKNGTYNYFLLQDNSLPIIHFVLPEFPLFVYVGDITSASWEEARARGVSREKWELTQGNINLYSENLSLISTEGTLSNPKVLILTWADSTNPFHLYKLIKELFIPAEAN